MKKGNSTGLILFVLLFVISAYSQTILSNSDFSGTWIWKANNNYHQTEIMQNGIEIKLKEIIQSKDKPKIKRESVYFIDGSGETNKFYEDKVTESITTLTKNKITISYLYSEPKSNKKMKVSSVELKLKNNKLIWTQSNFVLKLLPDIFNQSAVSVKTFKKII